MRSYRLVALTALTALAVAGCKQEDDEPRARRLTILFTTDEHSHLLAVGPESDDWPLPAGAGDGSLVGGIARRATILDAERTAATQRGGEAVVVSSGDFSQGTLSGVAFVPSNPDLGLMHALGYDVVAIGNHEFDLGPAALGAAISAATSKPQLVLTNVVFDDASGADDPLQGQHGARGSGKAVTRSHLVITGGGLRVGFVSSMGYDAARAAFASAPVRFADVGPDATRHEFLASAAEMIQAELDGLRADGADVLVLLGHGGIKAAGGGDDELLVPLLSGLDVVLAGHTHLQDGPRLVTAKDGLAVPILAADAYGRTVGRVDLVVHSSGRPTLVEDQTAFILVDSTVAPTASPTVRGALAQVIAGIEALFLPGTLQAVLGTSVPDDPSVAGDLYFHELCETTFDVPGLRQPGETAGLNLDTDAMLAVAAEIGSGAEVALQASGSVRGDLFAGAITMADVFRMVPLGADPISQTPGYPLVRVHLATVALRAALEGTLGMALFDSADFYVSPAGLRVVYDLTRAPLGVDPTGPGWITELALVAPDGAVTPLYDASVTMEGLPAGWTSNPLALRSVVTTYQVAAFADSLGVTLLDEAGAPLASLDDAVLHWPGATPSPVKDHQALGRYVASTCAANGGTLPSSYDEDAEGAVPQRMICEGAFCPAG